MKAFPAPLVIAALLTVAGSCSNQPHCITYSPDPGVLLSTPPTSPYPDSALHRLDTLLRQSGVVAFYNTGYLYCWKSDSLLTMSPEQYRKTMLDSIARKIHDYVWGADKYPEWTDASPSQPLIFRVQYSKGGVGAPEYAIDYYYDDQHPVSR